MVANRRNVGTVCRSQLTHGLQLRSTAAAVVGERINERIRRQPALSARYLGLSSFRYSYTVTVTRSSALAQFPAGSFACHRGPGPARTKRDSGFSDTAWRDGTVRRRVGDDFHGPNRVPWQRTSRKKKNDRRIQRQTTFGARKSSLGRALSRGGADDRRPAATSPEHAGGGSERGRRRENWKPPADRRPVTGRITRFRYCNYQGILVSTYALITTIMWLLMLKIKNE